MFKALDQTSKTIARFLAVVAGIAMLSIVAIIMLEVVMRSAGRPLLGAIELVRIAFVISVFFAFAYVTTSEREIRVDVLRSLLPISLIRVLDVFASIVTMTFFGLFFWLSIDRLMEAWEFDIFLEGQLLLPMWIPWATVMFGSLIAVMASICSLIKHIVTKPRAADPHEISAATLQIS